MTTLPTFEDLARLIADASLLRGEFTLRSGRTSHYYLDKYRFSTKPEILQPLAQMFRERIPEGTQRLAGAELAVFLWWRPHRWPLDCRQSSFAVNGRPTGPGSGLRATLKRARAWFSWKTWPPREAKHLRQWKCCKKLRSSQWCHQCDQS